MKKSLFLITLFAICLLTSCDKNSEVKDFIMDFASKVNVKDSTAVNEMYPEAKTFKLTALDFERGDIDVTKVDGKDNEFIAKIGDSKEITVIKFSDGKYQIKSSRGFLLIPANDMNIAMKTGWIDPKLSDAENSKRLGNEGFRIYLTDIINSKLQGKVRVGKINSNEVSRKADGWYDDYHNDPMSWKYRQKISIEVINDLDIELPANGYSCLCKVKVWGYMDSTNSSNHQVEPKAVPAHGSVTLEYIYAGSDECVEGTGGFLNATAEIIIDAGAFDTSKFYTPTGKEYAEYVAKYGESSTEISGKYVGKLGGDNGSVLTIAGKIGSYTFTGAGGRDIRVANYNPATQELVLDALIKDSKIGEFRGTIDPATGRYKGTFTNTTNGAKLPFDYAKQ